MAFEIIRNRLYGLKPLGRDDAITDHRLYDDLFPGDAGSNTYAFIDGARIPDLEERLEQHPGLAICLDGSPDSGAMKWSLPWLVELKPEDRLSGNLLSDKPIRGLWEADAGLFFETPLEANELVRHLRKFHRPRIGAGTVPVFLRFWEPELLLHLLDMNCRHVQALPRPDLRIIARFDDEAHVMTTNMDSPIRPGMLLQEEADAIGLILISRRRKTLAEKIAKTFPDEIKHLSPRALEREVHDAWMAANSYGLRNGRVRAKFIIMAVAIAPGIHREPEVEKMFALSADPERSFTELDSVIQRRIGSISAKEVI